LILPLVPASPLQVVGVVLRYLEISVLVSLWVLLVELEEGHQLTVVVPVGDMVKVRLAVESDIMLPRKMDLKTTHSGIVAMQRESK
jgi:hypothetical protein